MDRIGDGWVDGMALHGRLAGRVMSQPRRSDWREARDLSLVLTVSMAAPLAGLALKAGASPAVVLALTAVTAAAAGRIVRVLRREYALEWGVPGVPFPASGAGARSSRWRTAALRLIPARHGGKTGPGSVLVSAPGRRTRASRPRRQNPGG